MKRRLNLIDELQVYSLILDVFDQSRNDLRTLDEICELEMADLLYLGRLGA